MLWLKQKKSHYNYLVKSTQSEGGHGNTYIFIESLLFVHLTHHLILSLCIAGRAKLYDVSGTKDSADSAKFSLVKMFISQKKNRLSDGSLVISDNETTDVAEPCKNELEDSLMCETKKSENSKRVSNNNGSNNSSIIPSKHLWKGSSLNKSMQTSSSDEISSTKSDTKVNTCLKYFLLIEILFLILFLLHFSARVVRFM